MDGKSAGGSERLLKLGKCGQLSILKLGLDAIMQEQAGRYQDVSAEAVSSTLAIPEHPSSSLCD